MYTWLQLCSTVDVGCSVQPEHLAAIGFATIKVVCRRTTSLLLRVLQAERRYHTI